MSVIATSFSTVMEAMQETIKESVNTTAVRKMASATQNSSGGGTNNSKVDNLKNQLKVLQQK